MGGHQSRCPAHSLACLSKHTMTMHSIGLSSGSLRALDAAQALQSGGVLKGVTLECVQSAQPGTLGPRRLSHRERTLPRSHHTASACCSTFLQGNSCVHAPALTVGSSTEPGQNAELHIQGWRQQPRCSHSIQAACHKQERAGCSSAEGRGGPDIPQVRYHVEM